MSYTRLPKPPPPAIGTRVEKAGEVRTVIGVRGDVVQFSHLVVRKQYVTARGWAKWAGKKQ